MSRRRSWQRRENRRQYCSEACGARRVSALDKRLEAAVIELLRERERDGAGGGGICPSEAARRVAGDRPWRALMEPVRRAARRLAHAGRVEISQGERAVDPGTFRGPVRIRRRSR